jgi:hypothetical protein
VFEGELPVFRSLNAANILATQHTFQCVTVDVELPSFLVHDGYSRPSPMDTRLLMMGYTAGVIDLISLQHGQMTRTLVH